MYVIVNKFNQAVKEFDTKREAKKFLDNPDTRLNKHKYRVKHVFHSYADYIDAHTAVHYDDCTR